MWFHCDVPGVAVDYKYLAIIIESSGFYSGSLIFVFIVVSFLMSKICFPTTFFFFLVSSHNNRMSKSSSPTREVAPRLVMGSKKYGRRSRPQITEGSQSEEDQKNSESEGGEGEEEEDGDESEQQIEGQGTNKVHRSASQTDVKRRRQPQTTSTKLKRCASLPARRNRDFVRIRGSSPKTHVKAPLHSSVESLGNILFAPL